MKHTFSIIILLFSALLMAESSFDRGIIFGSINLIGSSAEFNTFENSETDILTALEGKLNGVSSFKIGIGFNAFTHHFIDFNVYGYNCDLVEKSSYIKEVDRIKNRGFYITIKHKKQVLDELTFYYGGGIAFDTYSYKSSIESINYGRKLTVKAKDKRIISPCLEAAFKLNLIKQLNLFLSLNYNFNYELKVKIPTEENSYLGIEGGTHTFKLEQFKLGIGLALNI